MFYLTQQRYWHDEEGRNCLELASQLDAVSPGCIEFITESDDPREIALKAIQLQDYYFTDKNEDWPITIGTVLCYGNPDDGLCVEEVKLWGERHYKALDKCDRCGELLGKTWFVHDFADEERFCSEHCADEAYRDFYEENIDDEEIV